MQKIEAIKVVEATKLSCIKKQYVISTQIFDSIKDAEDQIKKWNDEKTLKTNTKVFEISAIFVPVIKLVEEKV